jgi:hypothetical protein
LKAIHLSPISHTCLPYTSIPKHHKQREGSDRSAFQILTTPSPGSKPPPFAGLAEKIPWPIYALGALVCLIIGTEARSSFQKENIREVLEEERAKHAPKSPDLPLRK